MRAGAQDLRPGLTLLAGFGLFFGIAFVLTRKEAAQASPAAPAPAPTPPVTPPAPALVQTPAPNPTPPPVLVQARAPAPVPPPALVQVTAPTKRNLAIVEPPSQSVARATVPVTLPTLDANLTIDEIDAVAYALARETDPSLLQQFAGTFLPDYPVTGSLLLAKAKLLTSPSASPQVKAAIDNAVRQPVSLSLQQTLRAAPPMTGSVSLPLEGSEAVHTGDANERGMDDVIESVLRVPDLARLSTPDLAARLGVPEAHALMATDALRDVGEGTLLVDPGVRGLYRASHTVSEDSYGTKYAAAKRDALERLAKGEGDET